MPARPCMKARVLLEWVLRVVVVEARAAPAHARRERVAARPNDEQVYMNATSSTSLAAERVLRPPGTVEGWYPIYSAGSIQSMMMNRLRMMCTRRGRCLVAARETPGLAGLRLVRGAV